jgi:hypothetical protein
VPNAFNRAYQLRKNDDGTYDSICLHCYRTVGTSLSEPLLEHYEANHTCAFTDLQVQETDPPRRYSE